MHYLFEPGLFASGPVRTALLVGTIVAVTSGVIGVFTVIRGQSFAGHALADVATTGGSGAFLIGLNQFWGFLAAGIAAAALMEGVGAQRRRGRDVATGVVLGAALGAAALFLYLGTLQTSTTGASFTVLFGSIFVISPDTVPALIASGLIALAVVAVLTRVLLLTSLSSDLARAKGVPVRVVGIGLPGRARRLGLARGRRDRGGAVDRAADRPVGDRAAGHQEPRLGDGRLRADRCGGDLDRDRARVRLLLLAAARPRLAGVVLRRHPRPHRLPADLRQAAAAARAALAARGGRMFTGLMLNTWIAATIVAVIAGMVGFFAVLRGQTFAAHAIPNGAFAGAAGASLLGINVLWGLAVFAIGGALGIGALGSERQGRKGRNDVVTALGLVLMLGLGALFISVSSEYAEETYALLFGEVFGISQSEVLPILLLGIVSVVAIGVAFRPLMLTSALPEVAEARGVSTRRADLYFLVVMALATSMTVPVVGALLMFSLMIGPAAAARSVTARPGVALALSVVIALVTVWVSIALSYRTNWPLGFFVGVAGRRLLSPRPGRPALGVSRTRLAA